MKKVVLSLFIFLIVSSCTQKTDKEKLTDDNKLDSEIISVNNKIKKCKIENDSSIGWNSCEELRMKIWEKKMTKYYEKLLNKLNPEYQQKLKRDQNNWLKWQKQHYDFLNGYLTIKDKNGDIIYGNSGFAAFCIKNAKIFQNRALELKSLIDDINSYETFE